MIGKLTGTLLEKNPPEVLLDCHGVGYEVNVPMSTFYNLPAVGERVSLLTQFIVREDAQLLYGFATPTERHAFRELIKISGVGPRTALSILSGMGVGDLAQAITLQEAGRLVKVPGIGKKTAERLLVELKDRFKAWETLPGMSTLVIEPSAGPAVSSAESDAVSALISLGYKPQEASRAVALVKEDGLSSEDLIRRALKGMG